MIGYLGVSCCGLGYTVPGTESMMCEVCVGRGWTYDKVYDGYGSVRAGIPIEGDTEDDLTSTAHTQYVDVFEVL